MMLHKHSGGVTLAGLLIMVGFVVATTAWAQFPPYSPSGPTPVDSNTLVLWDLNDGSGTTANDSADPTLDGANDGTLVGPAVSWTTGKFGGGLNFAGGTGPSQPANVGYVSTPIDGSLFTATKQASMAMWFNPTQVNPTFGFNYIAGWSGPDSSYAFLRFGSTASIGFGLRVKQASTYQWAEVSYAPDYNQFDGEWRHVTGTFDDGLMKIYINGVEKASVNTGYSSTSGWNIIPPNSFEIGGVFDEPWDTRLNYHGKMDDVRLLNTATVVIPEPSTFALCGVGCLAALLLRRRRA